MAYSPRPEFGAPRPFMRPFEGSDYVGGDVGQREAYSAPEEVFEPGAPVRGEGKKRGKKLWEYGSRYATTRQAPGVTYGTAANPKRLGDYDLGWESPSAVTDRPTIGGLGYSANIKNPIALDIARARQDRLDRIMGRFGGKGARYGGSYGRRF